MCVWGGEGGGEGRGGGRGGGGVSVHFLPSVLCSLHSHSFTTKQEEFYLIKKTVKTLWTLCGVVCGKLTVYSGGGEGEGV